MLLLPLISILALPLATLSSSTGSEKAGQVIKLKARAPVEGTLKHQLNTKGSVKDWSLLKKEVSFLAARTKQHVINIKQNGIKSTKLHQRSTPDRINSNRMNSKLVARNTTIVNKKVTAASHRTSAILPLTDYIIQGQDIAYYGVSNFGSAAYSINTDFDTGSSDYWIPSTAVTDSQSTTTVPLGRKFSIRYGTGAVSGNVFSDTVSVAGLVVQNQAFGSADKISSDFDVFPFISLLGLGFRSISSIKAPTFMENLIKNQVLVHNLFAMYFTRGQQYGSEISIGDTDANHYQGIINYTPVISQTYWLVEQTGFVVSSYKKIMKPVTISSANAVAIDSGTTLIFYPRLVAAKLFGNIENARLNKLGDSNTDVYSFPCSDKPKVALSFLGLNKKSFAIADADFNLGDDGTGTNMCVAAIIGLDMKQHDNSYLSIIGDVFLKNWYTVFSYSQNNGLPAVGFAQVK